MWCLLDFLCDTLTSNNILYKDMSGNRSLIRQVYSYTTLVDCLLLKGVIRIGKSHKDRQHNGQNEKDKQRSTKHYTVNKRPSNTNLTKNQEWSHMLWKGRSSCSTSGICRVILITNHAVYEWKKDREVLPTNWNYPLTVKCHDFHLSNRNHLERYNTHAGVPGMLLHINEKFRSSLSS